MITEITLRNFKCFQQVSITPKLVTLLIGPNGTGKSGLLQALMLLKQWNPEGSALNLDGDFVRLSPDEFVNFGTPPSAPQVSLSISGQWSVPSREVESPVTFQLGFEFNRTARVLDKQVSAQFIVHGQRVIFERDRPNANLVAQFALQGYNYQISHVPGLTLGDSATRSRGQMNSFPSLPQVLLSPSVLIYSMRVVPAVRGFTRRTYSLGAELHDQILSANGLSAQEESTVTALAYSPAEVQKISDWMNQITGVGLKAELVPPRMVKPVSVATTGQPSLIAEGSGTNALVHLLFELAKARSGSTVLIEEPEIHLHPRAQADLASAIVHEAKSSDKQIIMTTHSEHVAGRLMIEVAEGNLSADDVAIYSFEKDGSGVCSANEIEVTADGQTTGGLRSFFQTDLDEMRRYVDALRLRA